MYVYIKIHTMQAYMYSYYEYTLIDDIPTKENKTEGNLTLQIWIFCQELLDKFRLEKKLDICTFMCVTESIPVMWVQVPTEVKTVHQIL